MSNTDILQRFQAATARISSRQTASQPRARLVFALDATQSRQPTWDLACHQVAGMFEAVAKIGGLDVQLVYFRGHVSPAAGPFVSNARRLTIMMTGLQCRAGITQIGKVLDHVSREHARSPVAAFVYIGDTVEEEADELIGKAVRLGVKGFVFHEDPAANREAIEILKVIAETTGGVYLPFDQASAKKLGELLAGIAAWAAGGRAALAARTDAGARFLLGHLKD